MGGSRICGVAGGVGRMVCERVWCATGCSGVYWFPMDILGGRVGGAASVSTFGGREGVCTGDGGGAGAVGLWAITLGAAGVLSLGSGWVLCSSVEYGGGVGLGRKMLRMRVRASKSLVCSVAGTSLMAHEKKWKEWTMRSSGVTVGCVRHEW